MTAGIQEFRPTVIVTLVSDQPVSNITPALDPAFRPRKVILVQSPRFSEHADWIEKVLQPAGIRVARCLLDNYWEIEPIRDRILDLLADHEHESIALNISGGSKVMSLAAYEVFRSADRPVFYVQPESDELIWIYPHRRPSHQLADHIRLKAFVLAHGAEVTQLRNTGIPEKHRTLTGQLVEHVEALQGPLRALNWYAHQARDLESPELGARHLKQGTPFDALTTRFEQEGFLQRRNRRLVFPDEDSRFYVNGGWLEEHVFGIVYGLRRQLPEIQDLARSVEIVRYQKSNPVYNELDVAFLANNKLYIVECKTRHFPDSAGDESSAGAETIYKLDTLKELLGGLHGRAMLVSYGEFSRFDRQRASDLEIQTCIGSEIQSLESRLRNWIRS